MPKISIIVPVYKVEDLLHRCVDSILCQTERDFELILVEDGSPDRCAEICEEYAKADPRVRVLHQRNSGVSTARNNGLNAATGQYITFVDSDDVVLPEHLSRMMEHQARTDADIVVCGFLRCMDTAEEPVGNVEGLFSGPDPHRDDGLMIRALEQGLLNACWGKLYRAQAIQDAAFPKDICWGEDTAFVLACLSKAERIAFAPEHTYRYRHAGDGLDRSFNLAKPGYMLRYYRELFAFSQRMFPHCARWQQAVDIKVSQEVLRTVFALSGQKVTRRQKKQYLDVLFSDRAVNQRFTRGVSTDGNPGLLKLLARFPAASVWMAFLALRDMK